MPRLLFAIAILLSALASPVAGRAEEPPKEPIVIRFAHVVSENAPKGVGANLLKERVEAAFPGRVRVDVYPESRRFTDEEVLLALILGDVELAAPSFTLFQRYSPATQVFELPFLFKDVEHVHRFQDTDIGRGLLDSMKNARPQGPRLLGQRHAGDRRRPNRCSCRMTPTA